MHKLEGKVRAAVEKYHMIEDGDRVAVGVSGGKDSMYLLASLAQLSRYFPKSFTVHAITIDPCFNNTETDFSAITEFCDKLQVEHIIRRTRLGTVIFEENKEENPCSLCARMRRGMLHNMCVEQSFNKIALGHHMDDAVQTFLMNLLYGGKIGCFSPVTYLSRKDITMVRPLIFCEESEVRNAVARNDIPVVKSECPVDGITARADTGKLVAELEKTFPDVTQKVLGAMQRGEIDGW